MSTELTISWDNGKYEFQRKLGNFVQYFQVNLPTNGNGIPLRLVDPLLLGEHLLDCETTDDVDDVVVERAIRDIDFGDGLPIVDGVPIWERFDGEPIDYYKLFKEYREALYSTGSRAIAKLANQQAISGRNLNALAKVYHWQLRCRAYDMYMKNERERKRALAIEKLDKIHSAAADKMLEQGLKYLEDHPQQLSPKIAIQMIQLAMKAGRLALGLNAEKPGSGDAMPNINIQQTATGAGEVQSTISVNESQDNSADLSNMQSILHILTQSGALDKAKIIDAEYTTVNEDSGPSIESA